MVNITTIEIGYCFCEYSLSMGPSRFNRFKCSVSVVREKFSTPSVLLWVHLLHPRPFAQLNVSYKRCRYGVCCVLAQLRLFLSALFLFVSLQEVRTQFHTNTCWYPCLSKRFGCSETFSCFLRPNAGQRLAVEKWRALKW